MSMTQSRRKANGIDDSFYDKKFFIVGGPLKADNLPAPNHAQLLSAVKRVDFRYKHTPVRDLMVWLIARPIFWVSMVLIGYAIFKSS